MSEHVVNRFEVIDIEKQKRHRLFSGGACHRLLQPIAKLGTVRQLRPSVVPCRHYHVRQRARARSQSQAPERVRILRRPVR